MLFISRDLSSDVLPTPSRTAHLLWAHAAFACASGPQEDGTLVPEDPEGQFESVLSKYQREVSCLVDAITQRIWRVEAVEPIQDPIPAVDDFVAAPLTVHG